MWRVSSGVGHVGWRIEELSLDALFGVGGKVTQLQYHSIIISLLYACPCVVP